MCEAARNSDLGRIYSKSGGLKRRKVPLLVTSIPEERPSHLSSEQKMSTKMALIVRLESSLWTFLVSKQTRALAQDNCSMCTIMPSFYLLWKEIALGDCELFADGLNESGLLGRFCNVDKSDTPFHSLGPWSHADRSIMGASVNPPFDAYLISSVMRRFSEGAKRPAPYFRVSPLPAG